MSVSVNYTNEYGEIISSQQLNYLNYFEKHYFIDNLLKKKEVYKDGTLFKLLYYTSNEENPMELIESFKNTKVTLYTNKISYGRYNQYESLTYDKSILTNKSILIIEGLEKIICEKKVSILDNTTIEYEKYFYENDELIYLFQFQNNGDLKSIIHFDDLNGTEEFYNDSQKALEFDWTNLLYYKRGEPIVPL